MEALKVVLKKKSSHVENVFRKFKHTKGLNGSSSLNTDVQMDLEMKNQGSHVLMFDSLDRDIHE